jgi:hypothetical protein
MTASVAIVLMMILIVQVATYRQASIARYAAEASALGVEALVQAAAQAAAQAASESPPRRRTL